MLFPEVFVSVVFGSIVVFLSINPIYHINDKVEEILIDLSNGIVLVLVCLYYIISNSL